MPSLKLHRAIQFYASPAEMAAGWVRDHRLHSLFARLGFRDNPRFETCQAVPWDDDRSVVRFVRDYEVLYLSPRPLNADVPSINHIGLASRDQLCLQLPEVTDRGLTARALASVSQVEESLRVYRAVARDVLARTEDGVWFCQEGRKKVRTHAGMRYSPGAALLHAQGIPLCGGGRMVVGRLGLPRKRSLRPAETDGL